LYAGGGTTTAGSNAPGAFLVFWWSLAPDFRLSKEYLPVIFVRLPLICQNFHESWCRKSLAIEWHKNSFNESKNKDAKEL